MFVTGSTPGINHINVNLESNSEVDHPNKVTVQNDCSIFDATMKDDSPVKDQFLRSMMESHYGETKERNSLLSPHI